MFFEPKRIYNGPFDGDPNKPAVPWSAHPQGEVPEGYYTVPIGKARDRAAGQATSRSLTYGTMVHVAEAAVRLAGVDAEIIDVRTLAPLDVDTLCTSVCKTGRCVVVHEATRFSGYRRRARRDGAGGVLLAPGGADSTGHRLGYAVSACVRVGILSRAAADRRRAASCDEGC